MSLSFHIDILVKVLSVPRKNRSKRAPLREDSSNFQRSGTRKTVASLRNSTSQEANMQCATREAKTYNSLLPIRDAVAYLAEAGGDAVVVRALEAIVELGLGDEIGLRLLHKHNDLEDGEAMVECGITDAEGYALITTAVSSGLTTSTPNSWRLTREDSIAIEHSDPNLLCVQKFDVEENWKKFQVLYDVLAGLNVQHVLGPCINYNPKVYGDRTVEDVALLEKTDFENRANVVRPVDREDRSFTNSARTKWYAKREVGSDGRVRWLTACNCFCSVFPNGSGHEGTKTHQYNGAGKSKQKVLTT